MLLKSLLFKELYHLYVILLTSFFISCSSNSNKDVIEDNDNSKDTSSIEIESRGQLSENSFLTVIKTRKGKIFLQTLYKLDQALNHQFLAEHKVEFELSSKGIYDLHVFIRSAGEQAEQIQTEEKLINGEVFHFGQFYTEGGLRESYGFYSGCLLDSNGTGYVYEGRSDKIPDLSDWDNIDEFIQTIQNVHFSPIHQSSPSILPLQNSNSPF